MSSETDHPRQRTVAELLAQHGDTGATGRRRRRREADGDDDAPPAANGVAAGPGAWVAAPPPTPDRSVLRDPVPREQAPRQQPPWSPSPRDPSPREQVPREPAARQSVRSFVPEQVPAAPFSPTVAAPAVAPATGRRRKPEPEPVRENPTDHIPRYREDRTGVIDPGLTGPIDQQQLLGMHKPPVLDTPATTPATDPADDGGPATMVGVPPAGAESWHRARTDRPAPDVDGGPPTQAASPLDFDDRPAGLDLAEDEPDDLDDDRSARRTGSGEASPGQAWAAVVAQWILGAIGGAALWVGFRFLWRELPVVALAAAVLVTVGLVLVVRALLRNNDMRTTIFAVLVGLLLTVSPAILVLLGR